DNMPPIVVDRKHDAVAEAVVAAVGLPAHGEPGLDQRLARPGADAQGARQVVPAVGRITETEGGGHLAADSPSLEIRHGTLASAQLLPVKPRRLLQHREQRGAVGTPARLDTGLGQRQPGAARELRHRLGKAPVLVLHEKADGGTVRAAAEAVVELLRRAHREGSGLLFVERTAGLVILARLLQGYVGVDDLDDVGPQQDFVDELLGDAAAHAAYSSAAA